MKIGRGKSGGSSINHTERRKGWRHDRDHCPAGLFQCMSRGRGADIEACPPTPPGSRRARRQSLAHPNEFL